MTDDAETETETGWDGLKAHLRWMAHVFGEPASLFEAQVVERRDGLLLRGWLCALEAIARALLLVMALAAPVPAPKAAPRRRIRTAPPATTTDDDPSTDDDSWRNSERWAGVSFSYLPRERRRGDALGERRPPRRFVWTRRLAYRFEAVIRVAEAPERHAARLARLLARRRNANLAARLLRPPAPPGCASFPAAAVAREQGRARAALVLAHDTG